MVKTRKGFTFYGEMFKNTNINNIDYELRFLTMLTASSSPSSGIQTIVQVPGCLGYHAKAIRFCHSIISMPRFTWIDCFQKWLFYIYNDTS